MIGALARVELSGLIDEDGLARRDVAQHREAERLERDRLAGDEVLAAAIAALTPMLSGRMPYGSGTRRARSPRS